MKELGATIFLLFILNPILFFLWFSLINITDMIKNSALRNTLKIFNIIVGTALLLYMTNLCLKILKLLLENS